jgi:hypothetical protein
MKDFNDRLNPFFVELRIGNEVKRNIGTDGTQTQTVHFFQAEFFVPSGFTHLKIKFGF